MVRTSRVPRLKRTDPLTKFPEWWHLSHAQPHRVRDAVRWAKSQPFHCKVAMLIMPQHVSVFAIGSERGVLALSSDSADLFTVINHIFTELMMKNPGQLHASLQAVRRGI